MTAAAVVARRELGALFRTPTGYVLLGALALIDGLHFLALAVEGRSTSARVLEVYFHHAAYVMEAGGVLLALAFALGEGPSAVLWRTAPIPGRAVALGRFGAGAAALLLATLVTLPLPLLVLWRGHASVGHVAAGALGGLAVGLFALAAGLASVALARRPLLGGLGAAVALATAELAPMVASRVDTGLRDGLVFAAPVWTHNAGFRRGLLDLGDAVFLVGGVYALLVAASFALEERRWAP